MSFPTVITHGDADGIICLSLFLKHLGNAKARIFFSSAFKLIDTICNSIIGRRDLKEIYIFDLAGDLKALRIASAYDKVLWIDHHEWKVESVPENVELFIDSSSPSASQLVAEYFNIESNLVSLANEIDVNSVKSEDSIYLRDLVASLKWKYSGRLLANKLKNLAITLAFSGLEEFEKDARIAELMNEYSNWVKERENEVFSKTRIFDVNGNKIAVYETFDLVPIYIVNNKLLEHEQAPFDIIAVIMHRLNLKTKQIGTKIELRTHTEKDIYPIAQNLGGGGHKKACAATLQEFMNTEKFIQRIKDLGI